MFHQIKGWRDLVSICEYLLGNGGGLACSKEHMGFVSTIFLYFVLS
jgi:hypothetical protein